jgi:threonine/homoserine/homoserine lactone efflux protein
VFLSYLAWRAFRTWREYRLAAEDGGATARRSLMSAAVVNLLNPNPYLGWSLVMGPLLLKGWREAPTNGIVLLAAFYGTMVVASTGIIVLFAGARSLGPRVARGLVGVSAAALACFGCWQLWSGVSGLLRG